MSRHLFLFYYFCFVSGCSDGLSWKVTNRPEKKWQKMTKGQKATICGFYCIFINKYFEDSEKLTLKYFLKMKKRFKFSCNFQCEWLNLESVKSWNIEVPQHFWIACNDVYSNLIARKRPANKIDGHEKFLKKWQNMTTFWPFFLKNDQKVTNSKSVSKSDQKVTNRHLSFFPQK